MGYIFKAEQRALVKGLDIVNKEKKGVKEHAKVFGLSNKWMELLFTELEGLELRVQLWQYQVQDRHPCGDLKQMVEYVSLAQSCHLILNATVLCGYHYSCLKAKNGL